MRKIKENEIVKASERFAEIFKDYTPYESIFHCKKTFRDCVRLSLLYEVYEGADYTYTLDDDMTALATIKRPGDVPRDMKPLWKMKGYKKNFLCAMGIKGAVRVLKYINFASGFADKYYNPATDCYIKNIGVVENRRGQGILKQMLEELCGDMPIYLETHLASNVEIYKHLGFELLEAVPFHDCVHYCMKKN